MATKQDERYIAIARACLKAVNQMAREPGDKNQAIAAVYTAIDAAFKEQTAKLADDLAISLGALTNIRDHTINLEDAHKKAAEALARVASTPVKASLH